MATDLLSDGIRRFAADTEKLEKILMEKLWCVCLIMLLSYLVSISSPEHVHHHSTNKHTNVPFQ